MPSNRPVSEIFEDLSERNVEKSFFHDELQNRFYQLYKKKKDEMFSLISVSNKYYRVVKST